MGQSRYYHYGKTGKVQIYKEVEDGDGLAVIGHSVDASVGQNGAPLQVKIGGKFVIAGVHAGVSRFEFGLPDDLLPDDYYTASVLTSKLHKEFIVPTLRKFEEEFE